MSAVLPLPALLTVGTRWRHAGLALLLTILWILFWYRETVLSMQQIWQRSDTFAHGFLIAPIVGWLIWRQRHAIARQVVEPSPSLLPLVILTGLVWLLGELAAANSVTQAALVALLALSAPLLLGWSVARCIAFPLCFLFFAVPMGEFLLPQLMEWTANFTVSALRLSGVPVYREGLNFVIPSGRWSVVEACSGMRYLIAALMVGTLYAYLSYQSIRRRLLFIAASVVVPVVANWFRAYMIVMLAHLSNNRIATGVDHLLYGWIFFGVVIALMFWVGSRWAQPEPAVAAPPPVLRETTYTPYILARLERLWLTTLAMALLSVLPHVAKWYFGYDNHPGLLTQSRTGAAQRTLVAPFALRSDWTLQGSDIAMPPPAFKPAYQNPSFELQGDYVADGAAVGLYVAGYRQQGRGHALVSSENVLVQSQDPHWLVVDRSIRNVAMGSNIVKLGVSVLRRADVGDSVDSGSLRVWHIKWINGKLIHSDVLAKAMGAIDRLTGQSDDAAVIVIYTREASPGQGDATLSRFWADNYVAINTLLLKTADTSDDPGEAPQGANPIKGKEVAL
jgi:exosortase A